jgi:acyl carrier protein
MMDKTEFLKEMEILLETEPGTLTGRENLDQLADWNSLAIISFIAFADDRLGVMLSPKAILSCKTSDDLFDLAAKGTAVG